MALGTQLQVEAIADAMTACADAIHARLLAAIKKKEIDQSAASALLQDEATLRQRANSIYIDAVNCVVENLKEPQKTITDIIEQAEKKIAAIKTIESFIDFMADLLVFAAAVYAAKPGPILSALKEIKDDVEAMG